MTRAVFAALALVAGASRVQGQTCALFPIALPASALANAPANVVLADVLQGTQPGNFGWLTWGGSPGEPALVASLAPPGNSSSYVNPDNPSDHQLTVGDWVRGKPGVSNSKNVRDALDGLKTLDITVPVWDQVRGQGEHAEYHVTAFALVRLLNYQLPQQNRITARFLGYASCGGQNLPPAVNAGPDLTNSLHTLPATVTLNGAVTDDGLPTSGTLSSEWSVVSGPGAVIFANSHSPVTTATFGVDGTYVLQLSASDSQLSASDTVVVTINRQNQPPTAFPQTFQTDEDMALSITLLGSDPEADPLQYIVVTPPGYGILSGVGSNLVYSPQPDYNGPDHFTFKVKDGSLESGEATVSITVRPVNDRPVADSNSITNAEDVTCPIALSGSDVEGSPLTFIVLTFPTNGTLTLTPSNVVYYSPASNFFGKDSFTFKVNDGQLDSLAATNFITITPVNDAPIVDAGPDQFISLPSNSVTLQGTVTDDEFPSATPDMIEWSQVSGPGTVAFGDATQPITTAAFSTSGVYVVRLTASDSLLTSSDDVVVTINAPPVVNAGPDATNTLPAVVTLHGSASDDGLPTNGALAVAWAKVSGPGTVIFGDPGATNTTASFAQSGVYVLSLTASDSRASTTNEITITVNQAPLVDAGSDQTNNTLQARLLGTVADDGIPMGVAATPLWTKVSGPGDVSFDSPGSPTTTATFSRSGIYVLRLSASDTLASTSDEVTICVNAAPVISAGANQTVFMGASTSLNGSAIDDGVPPGVPLEVHWNVASGPGVMSINDPLVLQPTVSFSTAGTYLVRLTVSDSLLTSTSDVTITVRPVNHPPTVFAGTNQLILFPNSATLSGTVSDDGEPAGGTLTVNWSKISGPGSVTFANASSTATAVSFSAPGVYRLLLTASDSELSASSDLFITVNAAPQVNAGPDQITTVSNLLMLNGVVIDDALPSNSLTFAWTQVSGPAAALFTQPTSTNTGVRFTVAGNYLLRLSATDGHAASSDDVAVSVRPAGQNTPPRVDAGTNQYVALTNRAELRGSVTDDGLPFGAPLTVTWSKVSGPGNVSFDETNRAGTFATFSAPGEYVLRLTASDTEFTVAADVTITIYPDNQPPVVNAGADQTIATGPATLSGTVSDDGLPTSATLTFHWSKISGPGFVTFANSNNAVSTVTFSEAGTYTFRFTASDSQFSSSDDVVITVTGNQPPIVNAGPDQVLDLFVASGGATTSTVTYPPNPDAWRRESGQPGLTGVWGNIGSSTRVLRYGLSWNGTDLYVGGGFQFANNVEVRNIARWNGCTYFPLYDPRLRDTNNPASPPIGYVSDGSTVGPIAARGSEVFVAGGFLGTDLNKDGHSDFTARWSGTGWEQWQFKIASSSVARFAMIGTADGIYFGGQFKFQTNNNSGAPVSFNIAKWDGTNWVALGAGIKDINDDNGINSIQFAFVNAIAAAPNGDIYAGGRFIMQTPSGLATNLARWDGTNWHAIRGFDYSDGSRISALTVATNGDAYVGGDFTQVAGLTVNRVARWNGAIWSAVGNGFNSAVQVLAFRNTDLYAGGNFTEAGNVPASFIARWNGMNWSAVSGGVDANVAALAVTPTGIYAGGEFFSAGGQTANRLAKWGGKELPTLNGPPPLVVQSSSASGASVPVTVFASHPCGSALTLTWNVDGGGPEQTNVLAAGTTATPQAVSFTNLYTPGTHTLVVTLDDGSSGPVIFSTTVTVVSPATTTLFGSVTDDGLPMGGSLTALWDQLSGPASASFGSPNAVVSTASFTAVGTYVLRLTGNDSQLTASDTVSINVRAAGAANQPPTINAGSDQNITIADTASLSGVALDDGLPNGSLTLHWSQVSGQGTVTFDPVAANVASLVATFSAPGVYVLRFTGYDGEFTSFDEITITVSAQTNQPPVVNAGIAQTIGLADSAALRGTVTDDGLPFGTIISSWSKVSGPGTALFRVQNGITYAQFGEVGSYVLRLTANDGRLAAFDEVIITVLGNTPGPFVQIISPADSAVITAPTAVTGTVRSDILQSWSLQYRLKPADSLAPNGGEGQGEGAGWLTLATGTTPVNSASLATFDPTLLLNGIYELVLSATDQIGRSVSTEPVTVVADRNMKVGHFTLSFNDLTIPVAGIPIQITRTYDSRDKQAGDFGVGWTLDLKNIRLQKNRHLGRAWDQSSTGGLLPSYCIETPRARVVTITFPDGKVQKFQAVPVNANTGSSCQGLIPLVYPTMLFVPLANTRGTLTPLFEFGGATVVDEQLVFGAFEGIPGRGDFISYERLLNPPPGPADNLLFNPDLFEFTSQEGYRYVISETNGLHRVTDPNGNTLSITTNGITWRNSLSARGGEGQGEVADWVALDGLKSLDITVPVWDQVGGSGDHAEYTCEVCHFSINKPSSDPHRVDSLDNSKSTKQNRKETHENTDVSYN